MIATARVAARDTRARVAETSRVAARNIRANHYRPS